ncbi:MAG: hypothetical protein M3409_09180 [Gemmatimonadota bacterium]|nr:hypothetical protein [Gemmatimonadota bacterium]
MNLLFLLGTYFDAAYQSSPSRDWRIGYLGGQLNLGGENVVAAWYSSVLLLGVALMAIATFFLDVRGSATPRDRRLAYGWWVIAALFAALSLDELGSLHERIGLLPGFNAFEDHLTDWVGVFALPTAAVALFLALFAWARLRRSWGAVAFFCGGLLLFLTVPFQEQMEAVLRESADPGLYRRTPFHLVLEEGAEITGSLCFMAAVAVYALAVARQSEGRKEREVELVWRPSLRQALALCAAMIGILLCVMVVLGVVMPALDQDERRGNPANWFPVVLSIVVGLTSVFIWSQGVSERAGRRRYAFIGLALFSLFFSMDRGANGFVTETLWRAKPDQQAWMDAALVACVLALAAGLWRQAVPLLARVGIVRWAVLLIAGLLARQTVGDWAATVSFAVLLPGL